MKTNREKYMTEINVYEGYKTTCEKFEKWLAENGYTETFKKELRQVEDIEGMYYIAYDYCIPLIMVKKYLNNLD